MLRLVLSEPGPFAPVGKRTVAVSSELVEAEALRALERAHLQGMFGTSEMQERIEDLTDLISALHLLPVSDQVLAWARQPYAFHVTAMQTFHVATALVARAEAPRIELWTHLDEQANSAIARGLPVRGVKTRKA